MNMFELLYESVNRSRVVAMVWSTVHSWPIVFVTENIKNWGYDANEMTKNNTSFESLIYVEDLSRIRDEIKSYIDLRHENYDQHYRLRTANGRWIWIQDHTRVKYDVAGNVAQAQGMLVDVTENYVQYTSEHIDNMFMEGIARDCDIKQLLRTMLEEYESLLTDTVCSVLLLDEKSQTVDYAAGPSLPDDFYSSILGSPMHINPPQWPSQVFRGSTTIVSNIFNNPSWKACVQLARKHELSAFWSVPIKTGDGRVLGAFVSYNKRPGSPLKCETKALERTAVLVGLSLERARDQERLNKLRLAVDQSPNSVVITDLKGNIEYANKVFIAGSGSEVVHVLGNTNIVLRSDSIELQGKNNLIDHLQNGKSWQGEIVNRNDQNNEQTESVQISPIRQKDGSITHFLAVIEDITQRKELEKQIHKLAYFDPLTGLPNRVLLLDRFNQALSIVKRQNSQLALMFIDLNNFKTVNDTLGHAAGDTVLLEVSNRLIGSIRTMDTLSRQGGDEFVLLLPNCDVSKATSVAEKLIDCMKPLFSIERLEIAVSFSIGIAIFPDDGANFMDLAKAADVAMYRAKEDGLNKYRFFTSMMQEHSVRKMELEMSLHRAIERDELRLVYQPRISLTHGGLVGLEALVRWSHPSLGQISPTEFIPIAEKNGLILQIGEWVLRTAGTQLKEWMNKGFDCSVMAVNLSTAQFRDAELASRVELLLKEIGIPPDRLELELTESAAMSDPKSAEVSIDKIHSLGVQVAIDDFGTGYSSLSYLKRFKVDTLKIDQSFMKDAEADSDSGAIVRAIISMARSLGLRTIAEGVETQEQLTWLQLQGCDEAQGYLFSPPISADDLMRWAHLRGIVPTPPRNSLKLH